MLLSTFLFYCRDDSIIELRRRTHYITTVTADALNDEIINGVRGNPEINYFYACENKIVIYLK